MRSNRKQLQAGARKIQITTENAAQRLAARRRQNRVGERGREGVTRGCRYLGGEGT